MLPSNDRCTGCLLCVSICGKKAITPVRDDLGFLVPVVDTTLCVNCGQCERYCPQLNPPEYKDTLLAFYGFSKSSKNRMAGSSGGVVASLADQFPNADIVGCRMEYSSNNGNAIQVFVPNSDKKGISEIYGSKYVQSYVEPELYEKVIQALKAGREVIFTGTPCQCAAMKKLVRQKKIEDTELYLCEIMCHGVCSPLIFNKWYDDLCRKKQVKNISFRSKRYGWLENSYRIDYSDNTSISIPVEACAYHLYFGLHYSIRDVCFHCNYRSKQRVSDLTIGDFWGAQVYKTSIRMNEMKDGVSAILVNSEKGQRMIDALQNNFELHSIEPSVAFLKNEVQLKNYPVPNGRKDFLEKAKTLTWKELIKQYPPERINKSLAKIYLRNIKRFLLHIFSIH